MPTHQLYGSRFPEDDLDRTVPRSERRQAQQGVLQESVPNVQTVAAEPGTRRIAGHFHGQYANVMAAELEELLAASDVIGAVPYFVRDDDREWRGYYAPQRKEQGDRMDPRESGVHRFDGTLSFVGTERSHVRSVTIEPNTSITNPFGSASTETLYLSSRATRPHWITRDGSGEIADATVQATHAAEFDSFDEFDATEPSFSDDGTYALIYELPYEFEPRQDPVVWDDYDRSRAVEESPTGATVGSATVGSATVGSSRVIDPTWQRVYLSQHDYIGERVIETGRLRLRPDPDDEVLRAYTWNDLDEHYDIVQLGNSAWRLIGWDIRRIGLERIRSVGTWEDTNNRGTTYELVAEVIRGWDEVLFYEPANASGSTPADLVTRLNPIAAETGTELGEAAGLIERSEVPDE